jgi:hypothetical protein
MSGLSIDGALPGTSGTGPPEPRDTATARSRRRDADPAEGPAGGTTGFERAMRQESNRVARQPETGPATPGAVETASEAFRGRGATAPPRGEAADAEPASRAGSEDRASRPRPGSGRRVVAEPDAGSLVNAAAVAAGLGAHATPPRNGSSTPARQAGAGALDGDQGAAGSNRAAGGVEAAETAPGPQFVEERRRPAQELVGLVPGRKEPLIPSAAAPETSIAGGSHAAPRAVTGTGPAGAATGSHAIDLRPIEGSGVDGAILQSAAHLRIEGTPGGAGDIELHLRVRGDVTHVRIDGEAGRVAAVHAPELANALATVGLSLGRLETPPVAAPSPSASSSGFGDRSGTDPGAGQSQSQPQGQPEPRDPGASGGQPLPQPASHPSRRQPARGARVHVQA